MADKSLPGILAADIPENSLEQRDCPGVTARADEFAHPVIKGYGAVSGQETRINGAFSEWVEEIAPGAWKSSIDSGADVRSMVNHQPWPVLGRTSAGTLRLSEDDQGLRYEIDVNVDDPQAMSVHAQVSRGEISGSSVFFRVRDQEFIYPDEENGLDVPKRRILDGDLFETGPVAFPAYETTTAQTRSAAANKATNALKRADLVAFLGEEVRGIVRDAVRREFERQSPFPTTRELAEMETSDREKARMAGKMNKKGAANVR